MPVQPWVIKTLAVLALLAAAAYGGYQYNEHRWQSKWNAAERDAESDARAVEGAGSALAAEIEANTLALTGQIEADRQKTEKLVTSYEEQPPARDRCPSSEGSGEDSGPKEKLEAGQVSGGDSSGTGRRLDAAWVRSFNASLGVSQIAATAGGSDGAGRGVPAAWALRACTANNLVGREARGKLRQARQYIRQLCDIHGCQGRD